MVIRTLFGGFFLSRQLTYTLSKPHTWKEMPKRNKLSNATKPDSAKAKHRVGLEEENC